MCQVSGSVLKIFSIARLTRLQITLKVRGGADRSRWRRTESPGVDDVRGQTALEVLDIDDELVSRESEGQLLQTRGVLRDRVQELGMKRSRRQRLLGLTSEYKNRSLFKYQLVRKRKIYPNEIFELTTQSRAHTFRLFNTKWTFLKNKLYQNLLMSVKRQRGWEAFDKNGIRNVFFPSKAASAPNRRPLLLC